MSRTVTTTTTRKYDEQGRVVEETVVVVEQVQQPAPTWPVPQPYQIWCGDTTGPVPPTYSTTISASSETGLSREEMSAWIAQRTAASRHDGGR